MGECKDLPHRVFVRSEFKSTCHAPGSKKAGKTPSVPDPSLPKMAARVSEPWPSALTKQPQKSCLCVLWMEHSHLPAASTPWGPVQREVSITTSRHSMAEVVALAPAISLGSYGYRLCMKFSLAAQLGLLQFLPALPFSLFSSREHLGGVAINTPFTVSPSVPAAALPTLFCVPGLWPLDHLHNHPQQKKKKKSPRNILVNVFCPLQANAVGIGICERSCDSHNF